MGTHRKIKKWTKLTKTERYSLFQSTTDPKTFEVSWKQSNGYGRRRFSALSIETALGKAPQVAGLETERQPCSLSLAEVFQMTARSIARGEVSLRQWWYDVERFLRWLVQHYSQCTYWHQLSRQVVRQYLAVYRDRSTNTQRHALVPIRQASRYMALEYGFQNFAEGMGVGKRLKSTPKEVYLPDVLAFCVFLRERCPRIETGIALQGLAGLQLMEATRLTWDRVDLKRGLIEISGQVKNEYRNRVIPVCSRVRKALERAYKARRDAKVQPMRDAVLLDGHGNPFRDYLVYSKTVRKQLRQWNPKVEWAPKDLRNCLPTFAATKGLLNDVWEQYLGHSPKTITARHYIPRLASPSLGEGEALQRQVKLFESLVLDPLEQAILEGEGHEALNIFEREGR